MVSFPVGNQFPTPGYISNIDLDNRVDKPIDALFALIQAVPIGYLTSLKTTGPGNYSTLANVVAVNFAYTTGRMYAILGYFQGVQNTSTGIVNVSLAGTGIPANIAFLGTCTAGATAYGTVFGLFQPSSSGAVTAALQASTSAATFTVSTGATIAVFDLGT